MERGLFCVFEGIDGSGKSTLVESTYKACLADPELMRRYAGARLLAEPSDLPGGRLIREQLRASAQLSPDRWLEMFMEDRAENLRRNVGPLREDGFLVLQDRYFYSTAAYQGGVHEGLTPQYILEANRGRGFPEPDLLFYLDITPQKALERIRASREGTESFEKEELLKRIYANYQAVLPPATVRLDATLSPAELTALVLERIRAAAP